MTFATIYKELVDHYNHQYRFDVLLRGRVMVYVSKYSPLAFRDAITPEELSDQTIVLLDTRYANLFFDNLNRRFGPMKVLFISKSTDAVRKAILSGSAVSFIPDFCMMEDPDVKNGEIVSIPIRDYEAANIAFGWIHVNNKPLSFPARKFIEYLNR